MPNLTITGKQETLAELKKFLFYSGMLKEDCRTKGRMPETLFNITEGLQVIQHMLLTEEYKNEPGAKPTDTLFTWQQRLELMHMMLGIFTIINDHCYNEIQMLNDDDSAKKTTEAKNATH